MRKIVLVLLLIQLGLVAGYAQSKQIFVHDPVAIEADGKYYLFCTGPGITTFSSDDALNWKDSAAVFDTNPAWCKKAIPGFGGHMWAPDIFFNNGTFYLYYSVSSFGGNLSAIGVATNKSLDSKSKDFKWVDHGPVIKSYPGRDMWNAIDANLILDNDGTPWMSFGSFWEGLKLVKMDKDLLKLAEPQEWHTIARRERNFLLADNDAGNGAVEGPFIMKKGEYFYLFVSFDFCCRGPRSTYNVRVGRSKNIRGPYLDKQGLRMDQGGGSLVIQGEGRLTDTSAVADQDFFAIGHNSAYSFSKGDFMFSHGYDKNDGGKQKLIVHKITWEEAWPVLTKLTK